jgi:hypothetical protein
MKSSFFLLTMLLGVSDLHAQSAFDVTSYSSEIVYYLNNQDNNFMQLCVFNHKPEVGNYLSIGDVNHGSRDHVWKFVKNDDGYYFIVNDSTGLYLEPQSATPSENSKIKLNRPIGNDAQKWAVVPSNDYSFYIMPKLNDNLYLTILGGRCILSTFSNQPDKFQKFNQNVACPFLSVKTKDNFTDISEIVRNIRGKSMETFDKVEIPAIYCKVDSLIIRIEERKDEVSYINQVTLNIGDLVIYPEWDDISKSVMNDDSNYRVLQQGEFFDLSFKLPENIGREVVQVCAKGYYVPSQCASTKN